MYLSQYTQLHEDALTHHLSIFLSVSVYHLHVIEPSAINIPKYMVLHDTLPCQQSLLRSSWQKSGRSKETLLAG